ncbi:hypothetical protein ABNE09_00005, partial [Paenibacillus larvae]
RAMNMAPFIFWNLAFYTIIRTQLQLHHNPTENAHLQSYAKKLLQQESEIKVIKKLRKEKGMSMLDAKKLIDSINK